MADLPEFRAFTVNTYGKSGERKPKWTEIGSCWRTQKGNLRLQLEAVPVNGQVILIPPKDMEGGAETADDIREGVKELQGA